MAKNPKILSIVLAGGEGTRLMPLTRDRAKPAVPFGGVFRLIDFPVFNVADIYVTVSFAVLLLLVFFQYKEEDLEFFGKKKGTSADGE